MIKQTKLWFSLGGMQRVLVMREHFAGRGVGEILRVILILFLKLGSIYPGVCYINSYEIILVLL